MHQSQLQDHPSPFYSKQSVLCLVLKQDRGSNATPLGKEETKKGSKGLERAGGKVMKQGGVRRRGGSAGHHTSALNVCLPCRVPHNIPLTPQTEEMKAQFQISLANDITQDFHLMKTSLEYR